MNDKKSLYHLVTFGCQMNQADAQRIRAVLDQSGYIATPREEEADLIVFLTCMVRQHAEQRLFSRVRSLSGRWRRGSKTKPLIAIGGCIAQHYRDGLFGHLPMVDLVFGPNDIEELPLLLQRLGQQPITGAFASSGGFDGEVQDGIRLQEPFSALVNIIRGCTNFCSYCIVPFVRGPEVSRPLPELLDFISALLQQGVREITLLGQNVNAYGRDLGMHDGFIRLLEALDTLVIPENQERDTNLSDDFPWIRFLTSHPRDFSAEVIQRMGRLRRLCEQVHLPLQAGADRVLAAMNRGYTRDRYLRLVEEIRRNIPGASLTTDIMCGFPGETDAEFAQTLDLVEQVRFDTACMYYFSPRPGTPAADSADLLPEAIRKERLAQLIELQNKISLQISQQLIGVTTPVMVEKVSPRNPEHLVGRSRTGRTVDFPAQNIIPGTVVRVQLDRARTWTLSGHISPRDKG